VSIKSWQIITISQDQKVPQIPSQGKAQTKERQLWGDSNEEVGLTDVFVSQPTIPNQNELILQLMQ